MVCYDLKVGHVTVSGYALAQIGVTVDLESGLIRGSMGMPVGSWWGSVDDEVSLLMLVMELDVLMSTVFLSSP